jgi:hypothetical protein
MQSGFTTAMDLGADGPDRGTTVDEPASSHTGYSDRKHFFMEAHAPALEQHSLTPAQRCLLDSRLPPHPSGILRVRNAARALGSGSGAGWPGRGRRRLQVARKYRQLAAEMFAT